MIYKLIVMILFISLVMMAPIHPAQSGGGFALASRDTTLQIFDEWVLKRYLYLSSRFIDDSMFWKCDSDLQRIDWYVRRVWLDCDGVVVNEQMYRVRY